MQSVLNVAGLVLLRLFNPLRCGNLLVQVRNVPSYQAFDENAPSQPRTLYSDSLDAGVGIRWDLSDCISMRTYSMGSLNPGELPSFGESFGLLDLLLAIQLSWEVFKMGCY